MQKEFITRNSKQTQKLGKMLSKELKNRSIIALSGNLGSGKTTFAQGILRGLKIKGPYTSPTFLVIKHYIIKSKKSLKAKNIYHIDAYRVQSKDILNLGWKEMINIKNSNIIIIEWADKIKKIIPRGAIWINFEWMDNNMRKIKLYENKVK